jgi:hypothetical protein
MIGPFRLESSSAAHAYEIAFEADFRQRSTTIAVARIGNGTRLRSSINIKGDMAYLLFSLLSMPSSFAMPRPEEYLQRRGLPSI